MEIIVTHVSSDFDSFAALIAAKKIYPRAQIILPTAINQNVREFITFYEEELPPLREAKEIDFGLVKRVIMVDTKVASRLGPSKEALKNEGLKIFIYDHHPKSDNDIEKGCNLYFEVGATTTILVDIIRKKKIEISPLEATLFTLGIYEDTGSFTYPSTSYKDLKVASYLLKKGADLSVVFKFLNLSLTEDQHKLLEKLILNRKKIKVNEKEILFSYTEEEGYVEGLSVLARKLSQIEDISVVFCWVKMKDKIYIVSRSDDKDIDVSKILYIVNGGGHPQAASAVVKELTFEQIEKKITSSLTKNIKKPVLARDIMSYPVRVVSEDESILKVGEILKRYGHSGIPLVGKNKKLVGIITRKDADKAINHGLSHAPVKGFKSHDIVTAGPDTSVEEIQRMMIEHGIGRIPIVLKDEIVGIITRKDILRFLHGQKYSISEKRPSNYLSLDIKRRISKLFPEKIQNILKIISRLSTELKYNVYLVGGIVRDILLNVRNLDIDIVSEGDGIKFSEQLAKRLGGRVESHQKFKTSVIILENGQHIDVATARIEYYRKPAALPDVEEGSVKQDLSRRDFTINAMALSLNKYNFGEILDFFGGMKDLKDKKIKVLHKMSFIEDPTRIFRAVRFEKRLGFKMDSQTEKLARAAIEMDIVSKLTGVRIRDELISIFNEEDVSKPIKRLYELGALKKLDLKAEINTKFIGILSKVMQYYEEFKFFYGENLEKWRLIFILLLKGLDLAKVSKWCQKMKVRKKDIDIIILSIKKWEEAKKSLKKIISKNSYVYRIVKQMPSELQIIACSWGKNYCHNIQKYITKLSDIKLEANGKTLINLGYKPSEKFRVVLNKLFELKLDGKIKSKEEEISCAKKLMEEKNRPFGSNSFHH